jgi:hypothetical protein
LRALPHLCLVLAGLALWPASAVSDTGDAGYLKLVDQALAAPKTAPWCEIRKLYPETSFYRAHGGTGLQEATAAAGKKVLFDKTPAAAEAFKAFMRENAGGAGAHFYAAYLFDWNAELVAQKMEPLLPDFGRGVDYIDGSFEKQAAAALLDCIVKDKDGNDTGGRSWSSAYEVISLDEEELVADKYYHVEPLSVDSGVHDGQMFNVMTVQIPGDKQPVKLYFRPSPTLLDGEMAAALGRRMAELKAAAKAAASGDAGTESSTGSDKREADNAYLAAVDKARQDFPEEDDPAWGKLRTLYTATSFYKPEAGLALTRELTTAESKAGENRSPADVAAYQDLLRRHYALFASHVSALDAYISFRPDYIDNMRETGAFRGLIASIATSGDGKSPQRAFKVIDTSEEYALLERWLHLKARDQKLSPEQGHVYEIVTAEDPRTGEKRKVYFNVDAMAGKKN